MAAEQETQDVIVKEVHTFNFPSSDRLTGTPVQVSFNEDKLFTWQGAVCVNGSFFQIQFQSGQFRNYRRNSNGNWNSNENCQPAQTHYYLLLENRDMKEASCAFHGATTLEHRWDPSQSETEARPSMDAIFDPANGYINEAKQLTFKFLFEVRLGAGSAYRWTLPFKHTENSPIVSCNQVPLSTSRAPKKNFLVEAMQNMFENGTSTDVTIEMKGDETIKAHKLILIAMSSVFQKTLEGGFKETKTKKISITDFPGQAVKEFVRYLYYQELSPAVLEEYSMDLWGLADKYEVEALQKQVVELRPKFVTEANVINLVSRADVYDAKDIKDFCLRFMVAHSKSIARQEEALRALPHHILADYAMAYRHRLASLVLHRF